MVNSWLVNVAKVAATWKKSNPIHTVDEKCTLGDIYREGLNDAFKNISEALTHPQAFTLIEVRGQVCLRVDFLESYTDAEMFGSVLFPLKELLGSYKDLETSSLKKLHFLLKESMETIQTVIKHREDD